MVHDPGDSAGRAWRIIKECEARRETPGERPRSSAAREVGVQIIGVIVHAGSG